MEKVGILLSHLEYIIAFWYVVWSFGILVANWYIPPRFGILCQEKSGNPAVLSTILRGTRLLFLDFVGCHAKRRKKGNEMTGRFNI
jgi:hypothetical protein